MCSQEDPRIDCGILVANLGGSPEVSRSDALASHSQETAHYIDSEVAMLKEARHPCIIRGLVAFGPLAEVVTRRHFVTFGSRRQHGISSRMRPQ